MTTILESKDLTSLTIASLFGKLREHELEMNMLNVQESEGKHVRNIALKVAKHKINQASSDKSEEETFSLLSKKFRKFLKKKHNKYSNQERYVTRNLVILMLRSILAMVVVNRGT